MSICKRCGGSGFRWNNAAERITACGACAKLKPPLKTTRAPRGAYLEKIMKKHKVVVTVMHADGYLTNKQVGNKGRLLSRKAATKVAARLRKSGYITNIAT